MLVPMELCGPGPCFLGESYSQFGMVQRVLSVVEGYGVVGIKPGPHLPAQSVMGRPESTPRDPGARRFQEKPETFSQ